MTGNAGLSTIPANVSPARRRRILALAMACVLIAGCDTTNVTPAPSSGSSAAVSGTPGPGETAPLGTSGPPGSPVSALLPPLPEPQPAEPGAIGQSLYDPGLVPDAIVAMLDQMGVEIIDDDGSVLRPGADRGVGPLSLTADEVRGLIQMTRDDLDQASGDDLPGPFTVEDLYQALASSLPSDYSAARLADAYASAYADHPEAFAAQVMLGMPIEPQTRLLRVQMWLLLIDGIAGPGDALALRSGVTLAAHRVTGTASGVTALAPTATLGVAAQALPPAQSPIAGVSDTAWRLILRALPTLAYQVPFDVQGLAGVHEGHGGQGPKLELAAQIGRPSSVALFSSGQVLLPAADPGDGVPITWHSYDEAVLRDHGQVLGQLDFPTLTDTSGAAHIAYQTKKEEARQRTVEMEEGGTLQARVDQRALIVEGFDLPTELYAVLDHLVSGQRYSKQFQFPIGWHEEDVLYVYIQNQYKYTFQVGGIAELHRDGVDKAYGNLAYHKADNTYRGRLVALSSGHAEGTAVLTLGGIAKCGDSILSSQMLYVIGEKRGSDFLLLRFYPDTPPDGDATLCQPDIPYRGGGGYQRPFGAYIPLNDTRWSTPGVGYEIQVPSTYRTLDYTDDSAIVPELGVCSEFYVSVTKVDPDASATPPPAPQPAAWQCR